MTGADPILPRELLPWGLALLRRPREFFRGMPARGGFGAPVIYAVLWQYIAGILGLAIGLVMQSSPWGLAGQIGWVIFGPLVVVAAGFIISAGMFLIWHLMGSKQNYETAFRCWAFMMPLGVVSVLLSPIPFAFFPVLLYGVYLLVVASEEVHGIQRRRAVIVWGAIFLFLMLLQAIGAAVMMAGRGGPRRPPAVPPATAPAP